MTLDTAINNALSGLRVSQDALAILSDNIANANTPGYSRRIVQQASVSLAGVGQGAVIEDVRRNVDDFLIKEIRDQTSLVSYASTMNEFNERIQLQFGQPGASNSINSYMDDFFTSLQALSTSPELASVQQNAVDAGVTLAGQISDLANTLQTLRLEADKQIKTTINFVNQQLERIYNTNIAIQKAMNGDQNPLALIESREQLLAELAEKISISVFEQDNGEITIAASNGVTLLDSNLRELDYTQAPSLDVFINGLTLDDIVVYTLDATGDRVGAPQTLVTSGTTSADIISSIASGEMRALTDMRDVEIPKILAILDEMASQLRVTFNDIHNDGGSLTIRNDITGTRPVVASDQYTMSGSFRIGLVNSDGTPVDSRYASESGIRPLTLNLDTLNSGDADGEVTIRDIMDEINYYYGPPQPRVEIGNLTDIKVAMVSDAIGAGNNVSFDFDMTNISANDAEVTINSVSVVNNSAGAQAMVTTFPLTSFTVASGEVGRTGSDATITFTDDGTADIPFTISVDITVVENNIAYTDTIEFQIGLPPLNNSNLRNQRYEAIAVSGAGDATIVASPGGQRYLTAEIVDADGNVVTDLEEGYLRLRTTDSTHGIIIDQLDSAEEGLLSNALDTGTGLGFSSFFELNDFFVRNDTVAGSALNFAVRSDIPSTPGLLATGRLTQSSQPALGDPLFTYEIGSGDNQTVARLSTLKNTLINFNNAGDLSASAKTLVEYAADVVANASSKAYTAKLSLEQEQQFQTVFTERFLAGSGVNLDEELANTILYQNAYQASARIISVARDLFDVLMNI